MNLIFKFNLVVAKTTTLPKLYLNFETNDNINLTVKSIFINQKSNGADIWFNNPIRCTLITFYSPKKT